VKRRRALGALSLLGLAGAYAPTLTHLWHAWRTNSYAGHGMLVPAFSALLLWGDRERLRRAAGSATGAGLPLLLAGLGILAIATWQRSLFFAGLSFPVSLAGLVWMSFGKAAMRVALFPIGFCGLWVPLPNPVVALLTDEIQELVASMAGFLVGAVGVPVYQHGTVLEVSTTTLEVAQACNGLRFMMAMIVLAVAFAYVSQRTLGRQVVLVLSAVPISILANGVRVAVIAVAADQYGRQAASGFIHNMIGKSVWLLALGCLGGFGLLLRGGARRTKVDAEVARSPASGSPSGS
jgi:exosortase